MDASEKKRAAARAALEHIEADTRLGVGTGSTVNCLIDLLPSVRDRIRCLVSSSDASTALLQGHGFDVSELNEVGALDVYIDGADESNEQLQLIKGGGGALTREKVLAGAAGQFVCIVDDSKLVETLGAFPLPVEVLPMAREFVSAQLATMSGEPVWREGFVTDNANHILDVRGLTIDDALATEDRINRVPGVVTVGIFAHRPADVLLVAGDDGVRELRA